MTRLRGYFIPRISTLKIVSNASSLHEIDLFDTESSLSVRGIHWISVVTPPSWWLLFTELAYQLSVTSPDISLCDMFTVLERKFVTKIRVRYHDPRWRWQQPVRIFTSRFLLFRIVFHVFDAGYRAVVSYCFYVIPESVIKFDKTAVNWCTKNAEDLGNSSVRSW